MRRSGTEDKYFGTFLWAPLRRHYFTAGSEAPIEGDRTYLNQGQEVNDGVTLRKTKKKRLMRQVEISVKTSVFQGLLDMRLLTNVQYVPAVITLRRIDYKSRINALF